MKEIKEDLLFEVLDLAKKRTSLEEASEKLDVSPVGIYGAIEELRTSHHYDVSVEEGMLGLSHDIEMFSRETKIGGKTKVKVLLMSDANLGLKQQQGDLLATAIQRGEAEGVDFAVFAGNIAAGIPGKANSRDFFLKGDDSRKDPRRKTDQSSFDYQLEYALKMFPESSFKVYLIAGWRDLSFKAREGRHFAKSLALGRENLFYSGDNRAVFTIGKASMEVYHAKRAEPYTKSYEIQGIAGKSNEAIRYAFLKDSRDTNADIMILGGRHVALQIPTHKPRKRNRGVQELIALPSLSGESASEKIQNILAGARTLGFGILTLTFYKDGSLRDTVYEWYPLTPYQRANSYLLNPSLPTDKGESKLLEFLSAHPQRLGELARSLSYSKDDVLRLINKLRKKGYRIKKTKEEGTYYWERALKEKFEPINIEVVEKRKVAKISDTHVGSTGFNPPLLRKQYKNAEEEEVEAILFYGDLTEGSMGYRGQAYDVEIAGADAQRELAVRVWPHSHIRTIFIRGGAGHDNDYWINAGHDVMEAFVNDLRCQRENGENLFFYDNSHANGTVAVYRLGNVNFMLRHPKGGMPKSKSYRPQEIAGRILREVEKGTKTDIHDLSIGHLHQAFFMLDRGIGIYLIPCVKSPGQYLEGKALIPDLGMWICEMGVDKWSNVVYIKNRYIAFDDPQKQKPIVLP